MKTYNIAVLGCGSRGAAAGRAYYDHPRTRLSALCDLVPERCDPLGDELGVESRYGDLDRMIGETGPDIVAIPTGTEFHHPLALRVLDYGIHIDIEKPLCVDLEEADEVVAKAAAKGARIAVHHQGRSGAIMRAVERAYRAGRIGELRHITGYGKSYYGGYGLMNIGTHMINTMLKLAGHCRSVTATGMTDGHPITPADVIPAAGGMGIVAGEHLTATLDFDNGVTANMLQHRYPKAVNPVMEFCGSEGRLMVGNLLYMKDRKGGMLLPETHYAPGATAAQWEDLDPIFPDCRRADGVSHVEDLWFVEEYVRALDEGRDHECSGKEGLHVVEVMMGILESAAYGRRVDLPQEDRSQPLMRWRREHGLGAPEPMPRGYAEWLQAEDRRLGRC